MFKKLLFALVIISSSTGVVIATGHEGQKGFFKMSDQERATKFKEKDAVWAKLTKEDKLKKIEAKHDERVNALTTAKQSGKQ